MHGGSTRSARRCRTPSMRGTACWDVPANAARRRHRYALGAAR
jgi:hypothetical protein